MSERKFKVTLEITIDDRYEDPPDTWDWNNLVGGEVPDSFRLMGCEEALPW